MPILAHYLGGIMKRIKIILLVLIGFLAIEGMAQNPKQSKKRKVKARKSAKKEGQVENGGHIKKWYSEDKDKDGVPNGRDKCPYTPEGSPVDPFGCPIDSDFDGIYDTGDACPTVKGPRANKGCPWGDRDNDGFKDNEDKCPDTPGILKFKGCPDTDGDGIPDDKDKCIDVKGPRANNGCPFEAHDSDKDGINDQEDKCPLKPGPVSNQGCPELAPEEKAKIKAAFENLLFESGKDIIVESSYPSLNGLANVLSAHEELNLSLEGHTDNVGDDDANMQLSKDRANAVKEYLKDAGISSKRITAEGFGETKPVDTNDTPNGRKHNRRVEMKIKYD